MIKPYIPEFLKALARFAIRLFYHMITKLKQIKKIMQNIQKGVTIPRLGYIQVKLNLTSRLEWPFLLSPENADSGEIQSLKRVLDENSVVVFVYPKSLLVPLFILKNIKSKVIILTDSNKIIKFSEIEKGNSLSGIVYYDNKVKFGEGFRNLGEVNLLISEKTKILTPYITNKNIENIFTRNSKDLMASDHIKVFPKKYQIIGGRYLEDTDRDIPKNAFVLFSKRNLLKFKNKNSAFNVIDKKSGISGFSLLRNADIYPFDLCYSSVLDIVDEFILALDASCPPPANDEKMSRQQLIEQFLDSTEHAHKIKIVEFDFKTRQCRKMSVPGRWIADVNNILLDICKYENCVYVMADEMYHDNAKGEIEKFCAQNKFSAMDHYFLHFFGDLKHIRNPQTVAYTHAVRVFKKSKFASFHDGYSFSSLYSKSIKLMDAEYPIFHIGYVIDFRKKAEVHVSEDGVFPSKKLDGYIENVDLVEYQGSLPLFLRRQDMISYKKIKKYLK